MTREGSAAEEPETAVANGALCGSHGALFLGNNELVYLMPEFDWAKTARSACALHAQGLAGSKASK